MSQEKSQRLKMFLLFWALISLLGAFNLYSYLHGRATLSLVVLILCAVAFIAWPVAYLLYFRKSG